MDSFFIGCCGLTHAPTYGTAAGLRACSYWCYFPHVPPIPAPAHVWRPVLCKHRAWMRAPAHLWLVLVVMQGY